MSQMAAQMRIHKVDAEGDVILGNPSQNVRVKKLHLDFLYPNQVAGPSAPAATATAALDLNDSSGRPMRQWVGQPSGIPNQTPQPSLSLPLNIGGPSSTATGVGSLASTSSSANASIPVLILGKELHSQILMASPKPWIDDLIISGPVVISRDGPPTPESPAWHVAGGHLRLASDANDQFEMQVVGTPARVTFGDGWIEGPVISIDQRTGHVRMDQPGQLCVPASLMSGSNAPGVSTVPPETNPLGPLSSQQNIEWLEPIKCSWQGSLLFDGHTAHIQGDIEIKGYARTAPDRLLFIGGKCQALEVQLTERVNLGNPGKTAATVQSITLRDHVDIRTVQTDINRRRISLEEIILPELTFEVATNIVRGQGPGEIHSQHQPNGSASNFGQRPSEASLVGNVNALPAKPFNGLAPTAPSNLQGLHLKFRDTMEFRLSDKQLTFMGKVEVGLGPINSLEQMIDLNSMRTLQLDQSLLSGDLLRIYDASDVTRTPTASLSDGAWEFEAMGNVNFESKNDKGDLVGKASRITYFQSKDLLVIRGDGRIPAEIRMRPEVATQFSLAILSIWQGSINTKTFQQGPNQEGEFQLAGGTQLIPPTQPLPDNWKSGSITPVASGAPGTGTGPGALPGALPSAGPARPRDGIQDWFKPGN
ncbi:MAG: hypothetical protein IT423_22075 [Pirellulaceae bacterium]|nr:hypothetical protein [Pirellulaceae bacterium]